MREKGIVVEGEQGVIVSSEAQTIAEVKERVLLGSGKDRLRKDKAEGTA